MLDLKGHEGFALAIGDTSIEASRNIMYLTKLIVYKIKIEFYEKIIKHIFILKNREYYNYIYLDPRKSGIFSYPKLKILGIKTTFNFEPFYVGKGKENRIIRGYKNNKNNLFKSRKIENIKKYGLFPISLKLKENLTLSESFFYEEIIINIIGRENTKAGPLTNLCQGGYGPAGHIVTEEQKKNISIKTKEAMNNDIVRKKCGYAHIGNKYRLGKFHTKETKDLIGSKIKGRKESTETRKKKSIAFKGRKYSLDHNKKLSQSLKGRKLSEKHIESIRKSHLGLKGNTSIKVRNIETGELFESATEASKIYKVDRHNILKCCRGVIETSGNFRWEIV